jgi:peptide/nickel transport system permease protein
LIPYIASRLLQSVFVLVGVSIVVFGLMFLTGDAAALMMPVDMSLGKKQIEEFRREMGFDRPFLEQYARYAARAARGDLGESLWQRRPALQMIISRLPATLELAFAALAVSLFIGVPVGIFAAVRRGTAFDAFATVVAVAGNSMPVFWLGIVLILIVSVWLGLLPASGRGGLTHIILPAVTLGAYSGSITARLLRSSLLDVLSRDYVRTARAKGLKERAVILRHSLKNAALPVVTVIGLQMGHLLGGAIITETVFAYPGMGLLAIQAVRNRDVPVAQAFVLMVAVIFILTNLAVDVLYRYLDPRVRYA